MFVAWKRQFSLKICTPFCTVLLSLFGHLCSFTLPALLRDDTAVTEGFLSCRQTADSPWQSNGGWHRTVDSAVVDRTINSPCRVSGCWYRTVDSPRQPSGRWHKTVDSLGESSWHSSRTIDSRSHSMEGNADLTNRQLLHHKLTHLESLLRQLRC